MHSLASCARARACALSHQALRPQFPVPAATERRRRPRQPLAASSSPSAASAPTGGRKSHGGAVAAAPPAYTATLLVQCPDQPGVIAALATLLAGYSCNVLAADQFTDVDSYVVQQQAEGGGSSNGGRNGASNGNMSGPRFFQRIHFDFTQLSVGVSNLDVLEKAIGGVAERYDMQFRLAVNSGHRRGASAAGGSSAPALLKKRCVILVSKLDHCLYDLLIRAKNGELPMEVPVVASNHPDLEPVARMFGVDFEHVPLLAPSSSSSSSSAEGRAAAKRAHEARLTQLIDEAEADLVVLARYMQIMSAEFCEANWRRTINIHHSFLP